MVTTKRLRAAPHILGATSLVVLASALSACRDTGGTVLDPGDVPPVATTVTLSTHTLTLDSIGVTEAITAKVLDQFGIELPDAPVSWSSADPSVATVADHEVTGTGFGSTVVTASSGKASAEADVTVEKPATAPVRLAAPGSPVVGVPGQEVDAVARAYTASGDPAVGHPVTFTLAAGQGTLSGESTRTVPTDATGAATVTWTLPGTEGTYHLTASSAYHGDVLEGSPVEIQGNAIDCPGCAFSDDLFILVPAGSFQMGSTDGVGDERPVHTVKITRPFYLGRTEVTQGQWKAVMGVNPSSFSACGDDCPVERVSWDDVQEFIARLNAANPGAGYRLPTEAEWEYAARAGTTGDYGGTGVLDEMGWYADNAGDGTHPVAQKLPNAWGFYDMHGNVSEWVQDWYSETYYSTSPTEDPQGPPTGTMRVIRGGGWRSLANGCRSAHRNYTPTTPRSFGDGFRLARTH